MTPFLDRAKVPYLSESLSSLRRDAENRPITIMEICGTHTVSLFRSGLRSLLPGGLRLISGPGCPVCVTAGGYLDAACQLAGQPGITVATYGDLVRVPGLRDSLAGARAKGGRVLVVTSPLEALRHAQAHPEVQVVFLGVGFETTAPATAQALVEAGSATNFSVLMAHKQVVPAILALLGGDQAQLDGFLCPGHVSVIIGSEAYRPVVARGKGCAVAGFEAPSMAAGLAALARMAVSGRPDLVNSYPVAVKPQGSGPARNLLAQVFVPGPAVWRSLGTIPDSGLDLAPAFAHFDAARRFGLSLDADPPQPGCRCGEVIQGRINPPACPRFGRGCTPIQPLGPCMVSSEGTCAAWLRYVGREGF